MSATTTDATPAAPMQLPIEGQRDWWAWRELWRQRNSSSKVGNPARELIAAMTEATADPDFPALQGYKRWPNPEYKDDPRTEVRGMTVEEAIDGVKAINIMLRSFDTSSIKDSINQGIERALLRKVPRIAELEALMKKIRADEEAGPPPKTKYGAYRRKLKFDKATDQLRWERDFYVRQQEALRVNQKRLADLEVREPCPTHPCCRAS